MGLLVGIASVLRGGQYVLVRISYNILEFKLSKGFPSLESSLTNHNLYFKITATSTSANTDYHHRMEVGMLCMLGEVGEVRVNA